MRALPVLAILLLAVAAAAEPAPARPNVLLICVDDLKPTLGCYGDAAAQTPNIDRLAARGMVLRRAYVQQAVCAPSRHALLTGLRPDQLGIYNLATRFRKLAPDAVTLPQRFLQAGWHAEGMGKIYHVGHGNGDDAASWSVPHWTPEGDAPDFAEGGPEMPPGASERERKPDEKPRGHAWGWPDVPDVDCKDAKTASRAVERLAALAATGRPFFMAVGFSRPHLPFRVPKRWWDRFDPTTLPVLPVDAGGPLGAPAWAGNPGGELRAYQAIQGQGALTAEQARTMVHGYYASTAFVDAQVGRVLAELDRLGLTGDTIIVLWGDHGWHLGDHGWWCKHTNYEQAARNPLIVAGPGVAVGASDALAATIDLYPTLCAMAGIDAPAGLSGRDLRPVLADPAASVQDAVFHVYPRNADGQGVLGRAVRTARWRYVEWRRWDEARTLVAEELYDLEQDPAETANVIADPAHAALKADLAARIAALGPAASPVWD